MSCNVVNCTQLRDQLQCAALEDNCSDSSELLSLVFIQIQLVKFNMGAKRVWNQILDDVLYQRNEFGFYLHEFVISLHLHKRIFFELLWRSKFRGTVNTICLNFLLFPPRPQAILYFCAPLYTLPCRKSVCSSQHCLEGGEEGNSRYPGG